MRTRCRRIVVDSTLLLVVTCSVAAAAEPFPVLTVCEALKDPSRYDGKSVIIVGRSVGTSEGSWLSEDCGLTVLNGGREFSPLISTAWGTDQFAPPPELPEKFKWDRPLLQQKLAEVRKTTKLRYRTEMWAAEFGRLETKLPREGPFGGDITGFGHQSGAPAQLVGPRNGFLRLGSR